MKDQLQEGEVNISEDFSENYALKQQNEIMTAHWSNESITLFCATVNFKEAGKKRFQHYVLVSDDLKHEKDSIWYYKNFIINDVRKELLSIKKFTTGQMVHLVSLRINITLATSSFMRKITVLQLHGITLQHPMAKVKTME